MWRKDSAESAAPVVMIGGVQRLMEIADEMNQKLEREQALGGRRGGAFELDGKFVDFVHHAILRRSRARQLPCRQCRKSEAGILEIRMIDLDVHKMPGRRLAMRAAILVGPGRAA